MAVAMKITTSWEISHQTSRHTPECSSLNIKAEAGSES
jgi:hypothetical protein